MNTALLSALHEIETDKGIPFETVTEVLEESLLAAYENREGAEEGARVVLDRETGDLRVMKDGEDVTPDDFTRIAAQVMRQTFYQRLNEVHSAQLLEEYGGRMGEVVTGIVQQAHRRMTLVDLGRVSRSSSTCCCATRSGGGTSTPSAAIPLLPASPASTSIATGWRSTS